MQTNVICEKNIIVLNKKNQTNSPIQHRKNNQIFHMVYAEKVIFTNLNQKI